MKTTAELLSELKIAINNCNNPQRAASIAAAYLDEYNNTTAREIKDRQQAPK